MNDPHETLGVPRDADKQTVKKAYRKLAAQYHPDRGGDAEKFKEVAEDYSILSDDKKKSEYYARGRGFPPGLNINDIFGNGANPFEEFFRHPVPPRRKQPKKNTEDSDIQFNLRINLEQIKRGAHHTINFQRNKICSGCSGLGGSGKKTCDICAGTGVRTIRPNAFMVQQATCPFCNGRGATYENPCSMCKTNGYVQIQDRVTIKIEEQKEE